MNDATLSLIIPVQDESASLPLVVQEALGILPHYFADFEILIVADGSAKETLAVAARLAADYDAVAVLHPHQKGYGAALIYALGAVRGEYVLVMDADRRLTISDIARFAPYVGTYDIVLGYRTQPGGALRPTRNGLVRMLAQRLFAIAARDLVCGFKLFRSEMLRTLDLQTSGALIDIEILAKAASGGASIQETAINYYPAHEDGDRVVAIGDLWRLWRVLRRYQPPAQVQHRSAWRRRALTGGALAALVASVYALRRRR